MHGSRNTLALIFKTKHLGFQILMFAVGFPDDQKSADETFPEGLALASVRSWLKL